MNELEIKLAQGDLQIAFNVNLNLQVLVDGDGENYKVYFIQNNKIVRCLVMGFCSKLGYYAADDIAEQYPHLPQELLLYTKQTIN